MGSGRFEERDFLEGLFFLISCRLTLPCSAQSGLVKPDLAWPSGKSGLGKGGGEGSGGGNARHITNASLGPF